MTTFDASTPGGPAPTMPAPELPVAAPFEPGIETPDTLLDQLRTRVAERDESEPDEWFKVVPGVGIRLVCDPDIDADDYQRWVKQAQSKGRGGRRRAMTSALDLDQFALSVRALVASNIRLDIERDGTWRPMNAANGEPLTLESRELMRTFNVMDAASLLKRLFGRDAKVIDAGQELLTEAGYLGGDDDENPV